MRRILGFLIDSLFGRLITAAIVLALGSFGMFFAVRDSDGLFVILSLAVIALGVMSIVDFFRKRARKTIPNSED